jgi:hypothetical protein
MNKNKLPIMGFAITTIAFVYLVIALLVNNVPLNLATWSLWVVIDITLLISIVKAGNKRPWTMIGFAVGATTIALITFVKFLMGKSQFVWGNPETLAAIAVAVALLTWKLTTAKVGLISITGAMYFAMIPTFVDQWSKPQGQDPWVWLLCSVGCILEYIGKPKTIIDGFQPVCSAIFNGVSAVLCFRQFFI